MPNTSPTSPQFKNTRITRQDFMDFFRDDDQLNSLSADDRLEVFQQVLVGSSDISKALLDDLLRDYCVPDG